MGELLDRLAVGLVRLLAYCPLQVLEAAWTRSPGRLRRAAAWSWSAPGLPGVAAPGCFDAAEEGVEAGGEPLVAVVGPDVLAEGSQRREAVSGQRAEERVQLAPGRGVLDALLVDGGAVAEREPEGVVVDQGERQGGFPFGQAGCPQRCQERLGQGEGVWPEGVAGLEQPGDAGVVFQDRPQPVREHLDLLGPGEGVAGLAVDLGQDPVHDEVAELFLAAHVPVQRGGDHAEAGGQGAHAQGGGAVGADDRERLGDHPLAGERTAGSLIGVGGAEPQQLRARIGGCLRPVRHVRLQVRGLTVNDVHDRVNIVNSEANVVHLNCIFSRVARATGPARRMRENDMTTMTGWDLFEDLRSAQDELLRMNRVRGRWLTPAGYAGQWFDPGASTQAWAPALDISERKDAYLVTVELPGVKARDVEITFEDGLLTIQGERQPAGDTAAEEVHRAERRYGAFRRLITLPRHVQADAIEATAQDGLLQILVPKAPEMHAKRIQVRAGEGKAAITGAAVSNGA
jgi:HSP20 family protein